MSFYFQKKNQRVLFVFLTIFLMTMIFTTNTFSQNLKNENVEAEKNDFVSDNLNNIDEEDEITSSNYGFIELWNQGDTVAKFTLVILFVMSL